MSYKKNIIPIVLAVLLHVGLIGLLVWNFAFKADEQDKQFVDSPVKARLVTASETPKKDATSLKQRQQKQKELEDARKKFEQEKLEKQKLEQQKQQELEQQKAEQEKQLEQQKLEQQKETAEQQKLEQQKKAEAEKQRLAKEAEQKRKAEEAKRKAEAERKKKAEAERKRKEAERKKREEAERKRKELEALEASLDDELFEADKGEVRQTQIMSEVSKIQRAIRAKIIRNWDEPDFSGLCIMRISMGPGGIVLNIDAVNGDIDYCQSAETAITRAAPLPSSDDPQVMAELKSLRMTFDPSQKEN